MSNVSIQIDKVRLSAAPFDNQHFVVKYKLAITPDEEYNYILVSNDVECYPNGNLVAILTILNLYPLTEYTVWFVNKCGGAGFKKKFVTGVAATTIPATTTVPATTTIPATTQPATTIPATTTHPSTTTPATTIPGTTQPATTVPPTTGPATTVPATTTSSKANLTFDWTNALSINALGADVNGIPVTHAGGSGSDFPFSADNHGFFSTQLGPTQTVNIQVNVGVSGQHISITDSNGVTQCTNFGPGTFTVTFNNVAIDNITPVVIVGADGTC